MATPGRPRLVHAGTLYSCAQDFYWEFRRIAEGRIRWKFDRKKYEESIQDVDKMQLIDDEDRTRHKQLVDAEIREGRLEESGREAWLREIENSELLVRREMYRQEAGQTATREIRVPGEPDIIRDLLQAETPERVCEICKDSVTSRTVEVQPGSFEELSGFPNWPLPVGSPLPWYMSQYAEEFVEAKRDPRYPRSNRPSSQPKQIWFLSRALAGAVYGVRTRTAINLVGSMRPEQVFQLSHDGKPTRKRKRSRLKS
jgi:hypothetical protein